MGELLKVWQFQNGYATDVQDYVAEYASYGVETGEYEVSDFGKRPFSDFGLEQQRNIVVDYIYIRAFDDPNLEAYTELIRSA